jgi:hypothetical protein
MCVVISLAEPTLLEFSKTDMPLKKYLGLLEELGLDRSRVRLLSAQEIANG